ncbi:MAG: hypothetical protein LBC77_02470 [Spirochaetaceae bacterium]|nr:hypothetical protein [Spirochaetaceae bacterium]
MGRRRAVIVSFYHGLLVEYGLCVLPTEKLIETGRRELVCLGIMLGG